MKLSISLSSINIDVSYLAFGFFIDMLKKWVWFQWLNVTDFLILKEPQNF